MAAMPFTPEEKKFLLDLARKSIEHYLKTGKRFQHRGKVPAKLKEKKGCFVTLQKQSRLRGCIGSIDPINPLYEGAIKNAYNAAFRDSRFPAIKKDELDNLEIEISVLTAPEKIEYTDGYDLLSKITPADGIILEKFGQHATFLPQVWKKIPEKEIFLSQLCLKAGLKPDAWQGKINIYRYQAEIIKQNN